MYRLKIYRFCGIQLFHFAKLLLIAIIIGGLSSILTVAYGGEFEDPRMQVANYVCDNVLNVDCSKHTIWISSQPVASSYRAQSLDKAEPIMMIPYEGWMVMIDDAPGANWGHNVRWLIVRIDLGAHTTPQVRTFPPRIFDDKGNNIPISCLEGATSVPCEPPDDKFVKIESLEMLTALYLKNADADCLHAVLISGGIDDSSNKERYRTNLRSMYSILLGQGYSKSNIFVYYADGASLDLDNADGDDDDSTGNDVTDDANETTIRAKIEDLCNNLNPVVDYLFVYVSDHGSGDGSICLWDYDEDGLDADEKYSPTEMGVDTAYCQVCRLFMLHDQCFSGAFLPLATDGDHDNTTVYAAATATESSWGREYLDCWEDLDHDNTTLEDLHQDVVDNCSMRSTPGKNEADETNDQVLLSDCCENTPPTADSNGPYTAECQGPTTAVTLDGTGSSDADEDDMLTYAWTTDCPNGNFDDPTSPMPTLTVNSESICGLTCNVSLTVTDISGASSESSTSVTIVDTTPPTVTTPSDRTVECNDSTDPSNTGSATATDNCSTLVITYSDVETPGGCQSEKTIIRTWTTTDACGNSAQSVQTIEVGDTQAPVISCSSPATITPPDAPISFTATASDNCDNFPSVIINSYDCYKITKKDKRIDKTESCVVDVTGDKITVLDSGGVDDRIAWTVQATDECGNTSVMQCDILVVKP